MQNRRRPKGSGAILHREDGRYQARVRIDGKTKSKICRTKKEANEWLDELKKQTEKKIREESSGAAELTLQDAVNKFLEYKATGWERVNETTHERLTRTWETILSENKNLKNKKIGKIKSEEINKILADAYAAGKSYSETKKRKDAWGGVYKYLVVSGIVSPEDNPMVRVKMIPRKAWGNERKNNGLNIDIYTCEEIEKLKAVCEIRNPDGTIKYKYAPMIMLILNTGMRCGEALALSWDDVDMQRGKIHVHKTVVRCRGDVYIQQHPKSNTSNRYIPINDGAKKALMELMEVCTPNKSRPVLYKENGAIVTQDNLLKKYNAMLTRAGIRKIGGLHTLRDCFASYALDGGASIQTVARLLGHSDTRVTERYYISVIPDAMKNAVDNITI